MILRQYPTPESIHSFTGVPHKLKACRQAPLISI
jgi:hypothetical protein